MSNGHRDARRGLPIECVCDGYRVVTIDGELLGSVAGVSDSCFVVELRRVLLRRRRAIPYRSTYVKERERTVVALVSGQIVRRSPQVADNRALDERRILGYYAAAAD